MIRYTLTDQELSAIQNILSALFGAGSSILVQWISKKKTKTENDSNAMTAINASAISNIANAQSLIDMWQEMLDEKEKHFKEDIQKARDSCKEEIEKLRLESAELTDALQIKVMNLTKEKEKMSRELVQLSFDKTNQLEQITALTLKLARYQDDLDLAKQALDKEKKDKILDMSKENDASDDMDEI